MPSGSPVVRCAVRFHSAFLTLFQVRHRKGLDRAGHCGLEAEHLAKDGSL